MWKLIKEVSEKGFEGSFSEILKNGFDEQVENIKKTGKGLGENFSDAFNNGLSSQLETKTTEQIQTGLTNAVSGVQGYVNSLGAKVRGFFNDGLFQGGGLGDGIWKSVNAGKKDTGPSTVERGGVGIQSLATPLSDMVALDNERLPTVLGEQQAIFMGFTMSFQTAMDTVRRISGAVSQSFSQIGNSIANAFGGAQSALGAFLGTLAKDALKIVGHNLSISMSNAITGASKSALKFGPAATFVLPALIAGATALISGAFSGIQGGGGGGSGGGRRAMGSSVGGYAGATSGVVTGFANGGIISGPTMGLVGEYPGARQNPEVIAPLNKLQSIIGKSNKNGNINVTGEVRVDGQDLLIAIERANETAGRVY